MDEPKFCSECAESIDSNAKLCSACGAEQRVETPDNEATETVLEDVTLRTNIATKPIVFEVKTDVEEPVLTDAQRILQTPAQRSPSHSVPDNLKTNAENKSSKSNTPIMFVGLSVIIIFAAAIFIWGNSSSNSHDDNLYTAAPAAPTATPRPVPTATPRPVPTATPRPIPTATPRPVPTATPRPVSTPATSSISIGVSLVYGTGVNSGDTITILVANTVVETVTASDQGEWGPVYVPGTKGDLITFLLNGVAVEQSAVWESGGIPPNVKTGFILAGITNPIPTATPRPTPVIVQRPIPDSSSPGYPTNLSINCGNQIATLSWDAPSDSTIGTLRPFDSYVVGYDDRPNTEIRQMMYTFTNSTSMTIYSLNRMTYYFRVGAFDTSGNLATHPEELSCPVTPLDPGVPGFINGIKASNSSPGTVVLEWNAPKPGGSAPVDDYVIFANNSGGKFWWMENDSVSTARTATITGLDRFRTYLFRACAKNQYGLGECSTQVDIDVTQ